MLSVWGYYELNFYEHSYASLLCTYVFISLGKYMGSGVGGFLTLLETAELFSETVVPFYTTVRNVWEF